MGDPIERALPAIGETKNHAIGKADSFGHRGRDSGLGGIFGCLFAGLSGNLGLLCLRLPHHHLVNLTTMDADIRRSLDADPDMGPADGNHRDDDVIPDDNLLVDLPR